MKQEVTLYTVWANGWMRLQTLLLEEAEQHATLIKNNENIICEIEESIHKCVDHTKK